MRTLHTPLLAVAVAAAFGLSGCGDDPSTARAPSSTDAAVSPSPAATTPGAEPAPAGATAKAAGGYVTYAQYLANKTEYDQGDVVIFFSATWCPSCQATNAALKKEGVPSGLTVVTTDYDESTDLKKRYGITIQHSFVQVDAAGKALAKWTGTESGAAIRAKTV